MTYSYFIGIDIGKEFFEAGRHDAPLQTQKFSNDSAGFKAFCVVYGEQLPAAFVVLEATGGYEAALMAHLLAAGVALHRADPRAASYFIKSLGKRAKTDRLDACALARYGQERHVELPLACVPDEAQAKLQSLLARRTDLAGMRTAEQNRLKHPIYASLQGSVQAVLDTINAQIDALHKALNALVSQSAPMAAKLKVMTSVKGVGDQTAYTMLGLMPELGTLTRKQAASLAGCAPHPRDSGKMTGYRSTTGGRQLVKRALFMAAMTARNFHPELKLFYQRLIQNGKKPMVAITAIMRKLIVILNAKIRDEFYA